MIPVSALNRKLLRDLWHMKGQVLAIALVIASGVATLMMSMSTYQAIADTTTAYYDRYRFGQVFASATRAPKSLLPRIADIKGVQTVQAGIQILATLDMPGFAEPVLGLLVSLPENQQLDLNRLALRQGRWPDPTRPFEVIVGEPFAEAHNLQPGDSFVALLNGAKQALQVAGVALSPEFIYAIGPGAMTPDDKRYGIVWMNEETLASSYDREGAFNTLSATLMRNIDPNTVLPQIDVLLERFGGLPAITRDDHPSHWFVANELNQLKNMSVIMPSIFLLIAAFLIHMVLGRLIATEREEIGLLKAFGYSSLQIGWHYIKLTVVLCLVGLLIGLCLGTILGRNNTDAYAEFFRFPLLIYRPGFSAFGLASAISITAAVLGALQSVRKAVRLPPAEAMIPPAPPIYRKTWLSRSALGKWLDQSTRILIRQIIRWPGKSLLTLIGLSLSVGMLVMTYQWNDVVDGLAESSFELAQRQDVTVGLVDRKTPEVVQELMRYPGVLHVEPTRSLGVIFRSSRRTHRGWITGLYPGNYLQPIFDDYQRKVIPLPEHGIVLSEHLARKLAVEPGDTIWLEFLHGERRIREVAVTGSVKTYVGMPGFMHIKALHELLDEAIQFDLFQILTRQADITALLDSLKDTPAIGGVLLKDAAKRSFYETIGDNLMISIAIFSILAALIAFGVAYNSTRIALSERSRELATLRVLGFSRAEIAYILIGEVGVLVLLSLPLGCLFGWGLSRLIVTAFETELYRLPSIISPDTYGFSMLIALFAAVVSMALVALKVRKLDLIEVLKTRE